MREVRGNDGGATMDSNEIEKRRGITIMSAVTRVNWRDHAINVIDTPGHVDFTVEVERSLRVLDGAVLVLCSVGGVQSQSLTVDRQMKRYGVPRIAFINKMDRMGANPERVIEQMKSRLNTNAVALQIPIGEGDGFEGVVDLVSMKAVYFDGDHGALVRFDEVPNRLSGAAQTARAELIEALGQIDDSILQRVLDEENPCQAELHKAIRRATIAQKLTPVLLGSAFKNKGIQLVLDAVNAYLPAPSDREIFANDLDAETRETTEKEGAIE